jgi:hypothetical protein
MAVMMIFVMGMHMAMLAVGTTFWLKRLRYASCSAAKALDHRRQYMIMADQNPVGLYLSWRVPVTQVPGQAHQRQTVVSCYFQQGLGFGADLKPTTIFRLQAIALRHSNGLGKIQQYVLAIAGLEADPATVPCIKIKRDFGG